MLCLRKYLIADLLEAIPHRMLGSHLTLNRTLATHILLVRLQPQPPPPYHREKLVIIDFDIAHPFLLSSRKSRQRPLTLVELDDHSSGRLREDSTTTS